MLPSLQTGLTMDMPTSQTEQLARDLLAFYLPFLQMRTNVRPTAHPNRYNRTGRRQFEQYGLELEGLELDILLPDINAALELQGIQHGRPISHFHHTTDDFVRQMEHDARKDRLCREQGICLVRLTAFDLTRQRFPLHLRRIIATAQTRPNLPLDTYGRLQAVLTRLPTMTHPDHLYVTAERLTRQRFRPARPHSRPWWRFWGRA